MALNSEKTGDLVLRSSCFVWMITCLQKKNQTPKKAILAILGMMNTERSIVCMILRSLENLLTSRPVGVVSKYVVGLLISPINMSLCNF
jgi:hypothetical protein